MKDIDRQEKIIEILYSFNEAQRYGKPEDEGEYYGFESEGRKRINREAVGVALKDILKLFGKKPIPIN